MSSGAAPAQLTLEELIERTTAKVGPPCSVYDDAPPPKRSIAVCFEAFHRDNPHVFAELVKLARRAAGVGVSRIGIRMLWERLRWQLTIETYRAGEPFKLNDHFHSRYVRLLAAQHPDLGRLFEMRQLRAH